MAICPAKPNGSPPCRPCCLVLRAAAMLVLATTVLPPRAAAEEALLAVAANFAGAVESIAAAFAEDTGHGVAGHDRVDRQALCPDQRGRALRNPPLRRCQDAGEARGRGRRRGGQPLHLCRRPARLWSPDPTAIESDAVAALTDPDTLFIAIANPELAPYGVAAREAMRAIGVWDEVQPKIVMGQNIGQTFSMVDSGAAQIGFVATSAVTVQGIHRRDRATTSRRKMLRTDPAGCDPAEPRLTGAICHRSGASPVSSVFAQRMGRRLQVRPTACPSVPRPPARS